MSVAFVDGMILYGVNAFLPIEASALFTDDPVKINLHLVSTSPQSVVLSSHENIIITNTENKQIAAAQHSGLIGVSASSFHLGRTRRYRTLLASSVFLISLFCGLLALVTPS